MGIVLVVSALVAIALLSSPVGAAMSMAVGYHGDCSTCEDNGHVASGPRAKRSAGGSRDTAAVLHGELASSNGRVYARPQLRPVGDLFAPSRAVDDVLGLACSFSADTRVLMADETTRAISEIEVGDWVLAEDPETGERGVKEVIALLPHIDQLLILRTSSGEIVTTEDHRFWNSSEQKWQESQDLDVGDELLTSEGGNVAVEGLDWSTVHTAPAYDLDVAGIDTYYVAAGDDEVLVHNCDLVARAAALRVRAGRNRVTIETPNGRMTIDLEGASHFEKTLQADLPTPHVKFETRHVGPNGQVSYSSGPVRLATHGDLRLVDRVLTDRGL